MVENEKSTEKKELTEIFCLRLNLEQKRYKKRMLKMNPEAVFGKAYEINCMLSIYETLIEKSEKMGTDILKCLLVIPDILHFFYRRWDENRGFVSDGTGKQHGAGIERN